MVWRFITNLFLLVAVLVIGLGYTAQAQDENRHLVTVYDRGTTQVFLTKEKTLGGALKSKNIELDVHDTVEPSVAERLIAADYKVNIYRARPVVVVDGAIRMKTISPYQTVQQIAHDVGIIVYDEDTTRLTPLTDFVNDGAGLQLTIIRAKSFQMDLYGNQLVMRTKADTVGGMLKEKNIKLGETGRASTALSSPITEGMNVRVWREGVQTVTVEQEIPVTSQIIYDVDQPLGYRGIQSKGIPGNQSVTYQVEIKDGVEISRVEIANIITRHPTSQKEVIGIGNNGVGLTKGKGAQYWIDSKGVSHRETYYDLNMSTALRSCSQGGYYTVRPDGAKVDAQGYIIIAANYVLYSKCSVVETSLGPGKVYDTGGFVARYPTGFDLATDWSNPDGI